MDPKAPFSLLRQKHHANAADSSDSASTIDYRHLIRTVTSQVKTKTIVVGALRWKLAAGLSIPVEDIDVDKAIHGFGIDSLVALEVRYWFGKKMKADVTIFDIMQNGSVRRVGRIAARRSEWRKGEMRGREMTMRKTNCGKGDVVRGL